MVQQCAQRSASNDHARAVFAVPAGRLPARPRGIRTARGRSFRDLDAGGACTLPQEDRRDSCAEEAPAAAADGWRRAREACTARADPPRGGDRAERPVGELQGEPCRAIHSTAAQIACFRRRPHRGSDFGLRCRREHRTDAQKLRPRGPVLHPAALQAAAADRGRLHQEQTLLDGNIQGARPLPRVLRLGRAVRERRESGLHQEAGTRRESSPARENEGGGQQGPAEDQIRTRRPAVVRRLFQPIPCIIITTRALTLRPYAAGRCFRSARSPQRRGETTKCPRICHVQPLGTQGFPSKMVTPGIEPETS